MTYHELEERERERLQKEAYKEPTWMKILRWISYIIIAAIMFFYWYMLDPAWH